MGARVVAMSPLEISHLADTHTRQVLDAALKADSVLFTSPNAVHAASARAALHARRKQMWIAVGAGTRRALARVGIAAIAPKRMDSEGLLDLPQLTHVHGQTIGLITGLGGRGVLQPALEARNARVIRADVYARTAVTIPAPRWQLLANVLQSPHPVFLALTSAEALQALVAQLPATLLPALQGSTVIAASERLAATARDAGFNNIVAAASARPQALLAAMLTTMSG